MVNMGLCAKSKARDERQPWDPRESEVVQAENVSEEAVKCLVPNLWTNLQQ